MSLRIGTFAPTDGAVARDFAIECERIGIDSLWTAEAWGTDALTPLAYRPR